MTPKKAQYNAESAALEALDWPLFSDDEIQAVIEVLLSGRVNSTTGSEVTAFEQEFAAYCERDYGLAVTNGTAALELAVQALNLGTGDEVIVTPRSFIASASSVIRAGAIPVFADICPYSHNLTAATIEAVITERTRAIMFVHLGGWPGDMDAIVELASTHGLALIEDCSQAHGARWRNRPVGSFGELAVFSFCQDKIMTTAGEGGMMLCNDQGFYATAYALRDHGRSAHPAPAVDAGEFVYSRNSIGSNYRMTELQAAVGRHQLLRLDSWVRTRRRYAEILTAAVTGIEHVYPPLPVAEARHAFYRYYVGWEDGCLQTGWDRSRLLRELRYRGVPAHTGTCPEIYRERAIIDLGLAPPVALPVTRRVAGHTLALPVHPGLSEPQVERMAGVLRDTLQMAIHGPGQ